MASHAFVEALPSRIMLSSDVASTEIVGPDFRAQLVNDQIVVTGLRAGAELHLEHLNVQVIWRDDGAWAFPVPDGQQGNAIQTDLMAGFNYVYMVIDDHPITEIVVKSAAEEHDPIAPPSSFSSTPISTGEESSDDLLASSNDPLS